MVKYRQMNAESRQERELNMASETSREEYQHELERMNEKYEKLQKTKTAWKVSCILFMVLFALTLALKLMR